MTSVFSWQYSISLCPASFYTPRPNLPFTPGVSWLPPFAFQFPIMKGHLFWVLVLEGLVGLHRTIQLLQHYWSEHRLGLPWYWMVCLGNQQRSLLFSTLHPSTAFRTLLLTMTMLVTWNSSVTEISYQKRWSFSKVCINLNAGNCYRIFQIQVAFLSSEFRYSLSCSINMLDPFYNTYIISLSNSQFLHIMLNLIIFVLSKMFFSK